MNALDIVILVFLALGAYSGYKQGLFISILSIVAFVVALIIAFHFMDWGAQILAEKVTDLNFGLPFMAFILIFLAVILLIRGLAFLVKKTLDFTILGSVDSFAGGILGVLKTAFILSFFLWIADSFDFKVSEDWLRDSKAYAYVEPIAPLSIKFLDEYTPVISRSVKTVQEMVKNSADGLID